MSTRIWLTVFFGAGTIMWYETINGSSWEVSMLVAVLMTLLALNEVFGDGKPLVVGLYAGAAFLARYDLALVWPIYFLLLPRKSWRYGLGILPAVLGYIAFNYARYGTLTDVGLTLYNPLNGNAPLTQRPELFAFRYLPGNLNTLFFMAPRFDDVFPYFHPVAAGQSILTTSPAFLLALRVNLKRLDVALIAGAALLAATPVLFYIGNGMTQFGARHFVDVFPFVLVLMAMGNPKLDQLGYALIIASCIAIPMGIYSIRTVGL